VDLFHTDIILGVIVHDFGQILIDLEENINTKTVVSSMNKSTIMLLTEGYGILIFIKPTCGTANYRNIVFKTMRNIVKGGIGNAKINGNIRLRNISGCTVNIYLSYNFMTTA